MRLQPLKGSCYDHHTWRTTLTRRILPNLAASKPASYCWSVTIRAGHLAIPIALLFFNVGVEVGQLLFIASVFAIIALARRITRRINIPRSAWAWAVPPYAIGSLAVFWVIQRIAAF